MKEVTNTVELIRSDCVIQHKHGSLDQYQIENLKNYIKINLYQAFEGQTVGKTVIVWSNRLTTILPAIKAIWEMGCNIAVHDINVGYTDHPEFKNFYKFIDLIVYDHFQKVERTDFLDKKYIDFVEYDPHKIYDAQYCRPNCEITSDMVAVKTHSSGTTGTPKILDISHRNAINIVKNNIKLLKFTEQDLVLHYKTLHHGSLFLNYAIPAFATSSVHYWALKTQPSSLEFLTNTFDFIHATGITKFLIPYNWIRMLIEVDPIDLSQLSLITIQGPTCGEMQEIFKRFGLKEIINNFGCTEVGTMFVSITNQSNLDSYNPNRFDHVMDRLEYQIQPEFLKARYPGMDWQILEDCFEQKDQILWWHGRTKHVFVDGEKIDFSLIKPVLESHYGTIEFAVVPDFEKNQLYLAIFDNKIPNDVDQVNCILKQQLGKKFALAMVMPVDVKRVQYGMKPSAPLLLYMFRNQLNNETV